MAKAYGSTLEPRAPRDIQPPPGVRDREWAVMRELCQGDETRVGFTGLRRRLDIHQEALRRALRRLTRDGFVAKFEHGYGLTDKGSELVQAHGACPPKGRREATLPAAQLLLPAELGPERVVEALAGRWFNGLRWYGLQQGPGEVTLVWESPQDGHRVRLRLGIGSASVDVRGGGDAALPDAARLVAAVVALIQESPPAVAPAFSSGLGFAA